VDVRALSPGESMIPIRNDNPIRTVPFVTRALIAFNLAVFAYELSLDGESLVALVDRYGIVPVRFWSWEGLAGTELVQACFLPFLTALFLHGGWLHLLGNVWFLWLFGDSVEDRIGHARFLLFYVVTGFLAGLLHVALHFDSAIPTIGASGAISGVMGAYFLLFPFSWITVLVPFIVIPLFVKLPAVIYLLVWIASQVMGGYGMLARGGNAVGGIAFWAHVGGFAAGLLLVRRFRLGRRRR